MAESRAVNFASRTRAEACNADARFEPAPCRTPNADTRITARASVARTTPSRRSPRTTARVAVLPSVRTACATTVATTAFRRARTSAAPKCCSASSSRASLRAPANCARRCHRAPLRRHGAGSNGIGGLWPFRDGDREAVPGNRWGAVASARATFAARGGRRILMGSIPVTMCVRSARLAQLRIIIEWIGIPRLRGGSSGPLKCRSARVRPGRAASASADPR